MFFYDQISNQWFIHPDYNAYFSDLLAILLELRPIVNKKWTEDQAKNYIIFIDHLYQYITQYIYTGQVCFYEDYEAWIEYMKVTGNPVGVELYEKQLDYYQKKMSGYDFKNDKKKDKDPNAVKVEPPKKR